LRKTATVVIVVALVLAGLMLAMKARAPKPASPTTQEVWRKEGVPVQTAAIVRGDMERTVEVTGDINALDRVTLSAKVSGRVAEVFAREGNPVSKGMPVIALDQQDALSNLQNAKAGLRAAINRLSQAQANAKVTKIQTAAAIEQAQDTLNAANQRLAVVKKPSRTQEMMVAENNVASAKANMDSAEANYNRNQQLSRRARSRSRRLMW